MFLGGRGFQSFDIGKKIIYIRKYALINWCSKNFWQRLYVLPKRNVIAPNETSFPFHCTKIFAIFCWTITAGIIHTLIYYAIAKFIWRPIVRSVTKCSRINYTLPMCSYALMYSNYVHSYVVPPFIKCIVKAL